LSIINLKINPFEMGTDGIFITSGLDGLEIDDSSLSADPLHQPEL
jgi:hypothetical protein